ncbi:MAG TPA: hypothetical protein VGD37_13655, partial [Kofleriaceae bacterium]
MTINHATAGARRAPRHLVGYSASQCDTVRRHAGERAWIGLYTAGPGRFMRHIYADFIDRVAKPMRYLGGEYQAVV